MSATFLASSSERLFGAPEPLEIISHVSFTKILSWPNAGFQNADSP